MKREKLHKRYTPNPDRAEILRSSKSLARLIARASVPERLQKKMFNLILWVVTEVDGKLTTRYRSKGTLNAKKVKIQHEHVFTRKNLKEEMLKHPEQIGKILDKAIACMVTIKEHHKLSKVSDTKKGWERYKEAGIVVYDMKPKKPKIKKL